MPETRLILAVCVAAAIAVAATAVAPEVDLSAARLALLPADASAQAVFRPLREVFRTTPYVVCGGVLMLHWRQAARGLVLTSAAWRRAIFVVLVLALGPGLAVNAGLKAHSHRPRPLQTLEAAGGDLAFRPFYRFDGGCEKNCSFSSGEAASAFWTTAPALLSPPQLRLAMTAAALAFGVIVSAMRMVAGAHFLSDVAFSALLVLLLTLATRRALRLD